MADYFHPSYRGTATSIYSFGIYIGGALSSLTLVIIGGVGWRLTFLIIGIIGAGAGVLCLFFVKEPIRNNFDPNKDKTSEKVVKPPPLT